MTLETALRPPGAAERRDAQALLNRALGDRAYTEADLTAPGVHVLAVFAGATMIGVGVAQEGVDGAMFSRSFGISVDDRSGCIAALAVDPRECGRGVAKALLAALVQRLRGCPQIIAVRRKRERDGLDRAAGFRVAAASKDFYPRVSREFGWRCPECREACACEAVLVVLPGAE